MYISKHDYNYFLNFIRDIRLLNDDKMVDIQLRSLYLKMLYLYKD